MNIIIYYFSLLIFICTSCSQETKTEVIEDHSYKGSGEYYYDFDEIDHYSLALDIKDVNKKANNPRVTMNVLYSESKSISDTLYIDSLPHLNFNRYSINKNMFKPIREIFRDKNQPEIISTTCIPWFSDILVFKKTKSITGVAKICFHCLKHNIVGSAIGNNGFGQSGDYDKLQELLKKNKGE